VLSLLNSSIFLYLSAAQNKKQFQQPLFSSSSLSLSLSSARVAFVILVEIVFYDVFLYQSVSVMTFFRSRLFFFVCLFVCVPFLPLSLQQKRVLFFSYFLSENPLLSFENPRHLFNKNSISFFTIYYLARVTNNTQINAFIKNDLRLSSSSCFNDDHDHDDLFFQSVVVVVVKSFEERRIFFFLVRSFQKSSSSSSS
jgi:hypothetical protein